MMRLRYAITLLVLSTSFLYATLSHCAPLPPFAPQTKGILLTLEGSNTVGAELGPQWAAAYLKAKGAQNVSILPLGPTNEYRVNGKNANHTVSIIIKAHGSSTGFKGLASGSADIAMSSRPIKPTERKNLAHLGDLTHFQSEHVVAIDGLAVIVNQNNPVTALSVSQIRDIFSGQVTHWKELGLPGGEINIYARDNNSGTWDTFKTLVLSKSTLSKPVPSKPAHAKQIKLSPNAQRFESNDLLSESVAADPNGIGFVGLSSVNNAKALAVREGDINPMLPKPLLVATEDYPLSRRLFLYAPARRIQPFANEFIQFVHAKEGQNIVEHVGFISQNPMSVKVALNEGPHYYQALSKHAKRLSLNFRFKPNSAVLDNKAKADILRLANYLQDNTNKTDYIQLVGFSDQEKTVRRADILSKLRATAVKLELFKYGIKTEPVAGFGYTKPVAGELSGGSLRNDRVEVWTYPSEDRIELSALADRDSDYSLLPYR